MGIFSTLKQVLGGGSARTVRLDRVAAKGSAVIAAKALIEDLRTVLKLNVRATSSGAYLEGVIRRDQLDDCCTTLERVVGRPEKPFDERVTFAPALQRLVDSRGGIERNQCLYLRRFGDDHVLFAAIWPWSDPRKLTLKVGVYDWKYRPDQSS